MTIVFKLTKKMMDNFLIFLKNKLLLVINFIIFETTQKLQIFFYENLPK